MVAITGTIDSPSVIDRHIIQLHNPKIVGSKQPYHTGEALPFKDAEEFISRCIAVSHELAHDGLQTAIKALQQSGYSVAGCVILLASGRLLPSLDRVLASHALIHSAEGELYRNALIQAAVRCTLTVTPVTERELSSRAGEILRRSEDDLRNYLSHVGHSLGPPWREDQKCATLAAWIALATANKAAAAH
jgi:hypothetical protein